MLESTFGGGKEHRTVSRVTRILELAARNERGVRLTDVAAELDAPRSSAHSLIKGLVANGYLRDNGGVYTIGPAVRVLLTGWPSHEEEARVGMRRLHAEFDETVTLVAMIGQAVVYTDAIESTQAIRYSPTLGIRRPLYPTSAGKCYLAHAPASFREEYLSTRFTDDEQRRGVRDELAAVVEDGVAINRADTLPDLYAVSVPVFDKGSVAVVLTVAGPRSRFIDRLESIAQSAREAARLVSSLIS